MISTYRRVLARATVLFLLATAVTLVSAPPTALAEPAPSSDITIEGGGWGHGVGLSQYGAYGQALLDAATAEEILAHYYQGTTSAVLGTDFPDPGPIWVNLEREAISVDLYQSLFTPDAVPLVVSRTDTSVTVPAGRTLTISVVSEEPDGTPSCAFSFPGYTSESGPCSLDIEWDGFAEEPTSLLRLNHVTRHGGSPDGSSCTLPDWNAVPSTLWRTCSYRYGTLHIRPDDDSPSFHLVTEIDIDDYVHGISEMPYYWGLPIDGPNGQSALEAQAIAARSYAVHRSIVRGDPEDRPWCHCQIYDTTVDQRYVGYGHVGLGSGQWAAAVAATAGQVRAHPDSTFGGDEIPVQTFYGSSTFGRSEPSEIGFTSARAYLVSVDDHWAIEPAVGNPFASWTVTFTASDLAEALGWPAGTEVTSVDIVSCSPSGAASEIRFADGDGLVETRPTRNLRTALGLRSPQITNIGNPISGPPPCGGLGDNGVSLQGVTIDDGPGGDSVGNDDGLAQCGETVELRTTVRNLLSGTLTDVQMAIASADQHLTVLHNTASVSNDILSQGVASNLNDWDIAISTGTPDGHVGKLALTVTSSVGGPWTVDVVLPVSCLDATPPPVSVGVARIDDGPTGDSEGNNDGVMACGETVEIYLPLTAEQNLTGVQANLDVRDPVAVILHNLASTYPDLSTGTSAENRNDWDIVVSPDAPSGHVVTATLTVMADELPEPVVLPVTLDITCGAETPPLDGAPSIPVSVVGYVIDDGPSGDSFGNNDGIAGCGETIELFLDLTSTSVDPVATTAVTFGTTDPYLTILHNTSSAYPVIPVVGSARNQNDFDIAVSVATPAGHEPIVQLLVESSQGGPWTVEYRLPAIDCSGAAVEAITFSGLTVDDGVRGDSTGNNDKRAQCGETIELYVALTNQTGRDLTSVSSNLATADPYLTILYNRDSPYPVMPSDASAENTNDWDIRISDSVPPGHVAVLELTTRAPSSGPWATTVSLPIECG